MSLIAWPSTFHASAFTLSLSTVQRMHASPFTGSEQVIDLLNDRWIATLELPANVQGSGGAVEGFIHSLRNMTNTVNLWHMARPVPLGTIAGAPTVNGAHAIGSATLAVTTTAGATVKQGDMLGANGLLLMAAADATADGSGHVSVTLVNRLRVAMAGGEAVTWNKPVAPFRCITAKAGVAYVPGTANAVSLDFVEAVS
jgi:hypothetical protein